MAKAPNLLRKVKVGEQWKMLPVVRNKIIGGEQRYDLTRVMLHGAPVVAVSGTFYLEYHEDGKKKRRSVGENHGQVKAALATQASVLGLRAMGVAADDAPQLRPRTSVRLEGKMIREVVGWFVDTPPPEYRHKSYLKYRNALESFEAWTNKSHCIEIERDDIKAFVGAQVRQQGLNISTARDKAVAVAKILRDQGAPIVMRKGDWPRTTRKKRAIYKPEVLKKLFAAADEDEYDLFQTFLLTGMREQEVSHLWWEPDFDPDEGTLGVSKKPEFDPKNYEERTIPIFDELVRLLKRRRKRQLKSGSTSRLIFPTSTRNRKRGAPGGQADGHLLRGLKQLAFRAKLNCGRCQATLDKKPVTCRTHAVCGEFTLHKFRHTYATQLLRDGMDLVSLQLLLGHKDLDSTKIYLQALEPDDLRAKVRSTSLATRFV